MMGVTHCNRKTIVKDSGRYHEIRWNVIFLGKRHGKMCRRGREESALPLPFVVVRGDVEGIGISAVTMTTRMRKKERYYGSGEMESHHAVEAVPAAVEPLGRHCVAQKRDGPA